MTNEQQLSDQYQFTNEWFLGNVYGRGLEVDIVSIWNALFEKKEINKILEIGAYEGRSTVFLAEIFAARSSTRLYSVDTWQGSLEHGTHDFAAIESRFDHNLALVQKRFADNLDFNKLKMTSIEACAKLISEGHQETFDLIYIDGSHNAFDVLTDAIFSFPLCKSGGIVIFDDYLWDHGFRKTGNPLSIPKSGVDCFLNTFVGKVRIIHGYPSYQLYCVKL